MNDTVIRSCKHYFVIQMDMLFDTGLVKGKPVCWGCNKEIDMTYKNVTCRGSYVLGTACGHCERCTDESNSEKTFKKCVKEANKIPLKNKISDIATARIWFEVQIQEQKTLGVAHVPVYETILRVLNAAEKVSASKANTIALNALNYIETCWQPKDGMSVLIEQCKDIRAFLTSPSETNINTVRVYDLGIEIKHRIDAYQAGLCATEDVSLSQYIADQLRKSYPEGIKVI